MFNLLDNNVTVFGISTLNVRRFCVLVALMISLGVVMIAKLDSVPSIISAIVMLLILRFGHRFVQGKSTDD